MQFTFYRRKLDEDVCQSAHRRCGDIRFRPVGDRLRSCSSGHDVSHGYSDSRFLATPGAHRACVFGALAHIREKVIMNLKVHGGFLGGTS